MNFLTRAFFLALLVGGGVEAYACMTGESHSLRGPVPAGFRRQSETHGRAAASGTVVAAFSATAAAAPPTLEQELAQLLERETGSAETPQKLVISIPAVLERSAYHPFGDGQSNAKLRLGAWPHSGFPVIGRELTSATGAKTRSYQFHASLNVVNYTEVNAGNGWYSVRPEGWSDTFYFNFSTSIIPIQEFVAGIPEQYRMFSGRRVAPDPAGVQARAGVRVVDRLLAGGLGAGYNSDPWQATNVHGQFPNAQGQATAVGGVLTWGHTDFSQGAFKHLYTCFEARDRRREQELGVPSGAGWHHIGDAAETLLHSLERAPLPVAMGRSHNLGQAAYGLSEAITASWLNSGEALIAVRGDFHWYANPYEAPVCTEIWVHNCLPNLANNWGFNCAGG